MRILLDADVLIGALDADDPHHAAARASLTDWHERQIAALISVVNLSEALVAPARVRTTLIAAREAISALGLVVDRPGEAIGVDAARLRGRHPISLPDAYCIATARQRRASVASFDQNLVRACEDEEVGTILT